MRTRAGRGRAIGGKVREMFGQRMCEADMRDETVVEESADAAARAIDELIGKDEVGRRVFLLQAANRAGRQYPLDAEHLHAKDVGPIIQLARVQAMTGAMTGVTG